MATSALRILAGVNHFIIWASAIIVTALISWFINVFSTWSNRTHIIYQEVIAVVTLAFWTIGLVLPFIGAYKGHLWPLNLIFSYLWITSFIFSAIDWSNNRCRIVGPALGRCGRKRTIAAFNFIAFFFLLCNTLIEAYIWAAHRRDRDGVRNGVAKERPSTSSAPAQPATTAV
ncbi:uncharacterized protein UV8b_02776 [Ustilaginoidea virens]|uniref:MARVEL domain-containing protein n=1 Tax=Ustilaginoidea virens TaxID=1159556 RepID=A0A063BR82_USTVR|nr:uncharacterized protein UV8b_02776 [Ustilaginoidea virens]QUC18535.1 hypothetical protein UV8b_02776 [Ustilaginoidea virens]GAO18898.1 hypothetical protein UVI_02030670 [Ustilaginoidea virens]